ncbi:MAG: 50S ribosomal protein L18 [Bacteroidia bacterium]|nr:50S ribosomal protein L18 [Bacteroidia bacterium]
MATLSREERRQRIKYRIRKKLKGTTERPRLCIFRSNKEIYAQIIDDVSKRTLVAASSMDKSFKNFKGTKIEKSIAVGKLIAERAQQKGIQSVVFDRNGFLYHGRVKALADAAREAGLNF